MSNISKISIPFPGTFLYRIPTSSFIFNQIIAINFILLFANPSFFLSPWCKQGHERIQPIKFIKYFYDGPADRFDIAHIAQIELHVESVASRNRLLLLNVFFV